jgi:hypothetical protein
MMKEKPIVKISNAHPGPDDSIADRNNWICALACHTDMIASGEN